MEILASLVQKQIIKKSNKNTVYNLIPTVLTHILHKITSYVLKIIDNCQSKFVMPGRVSLNSTKNYSLTVLRNCFCAHAMYVRDMQAK